MERIDIKDFKKLSKIRLKIQSKMIFLGKKTFLKYDACRQQLPSDSHVNVKYPCNTKCHMIAMLCKKNYVYFH